MKEKPSLYLVEKCMNLEKVIQFFRGEKGSYNNTGLQKRLVFLAQIDFWDWEMDELIYSVNSFEERSKAWLDSGTLTEALGKQKMMIKNSVLTKVSWDTENRAYRAETTTVAPVDMLNKVIEKWNSLLDLCEKTLIDDNVENAVKLGANYLADLKKFRKSSLTI